jgi:hypothetical protein
MVSIKESQGTLQNLASAKRTITALSMLRFVEPCPIGECLAQSTVLDSGYFAIPRTAKGFHL